MKEGGLVLALRGFVEDGGGGREEARKECHFRSHDITGPAGHFALFLFSARRARPDLSTSSSSSSLTFCLSFFFYLFSINARHHKSVTKETRETDGRLFFDFR